MSRSIVVASAVLLAVALLLPVDATARFLAGTPAPERVASGVALLKYAFALHALLLAFFAWLAPKSGEFEPLLTRGVSEPEPSSTRDLGLVALFLIIATALRLTALGQGLSFDEIDTLVHYARKPLGVIATTFDSQNQHLLYSLCARPALLVFDNDAFAVRFPAVVFGVASIWALHRVAVLVTDRMQALAAVLLLTSSYHHIWFSQNARGYTGLLFFTLLGTELFLRMLAEREPRGFARPLAYGACMAGAALVHATGVITVVAHFLIWLVLAMRSRGRSVGPNRWQPLVAFVFATSLSLLAYALVLPQFVDTLLTPTMGGKATEWKEPMWLVRETLAGLGRGVPGGLPVLAIGALIALLGAISYARQSATVLATFLLGSVLMAAALVKTHHNLWPRMFFFGAGFFVLIALRGVAESVKLIARGSLAPFASRLTTVALALSGFASAATLRHVWAPKQDFEGALEFLDARSQPNDGIATVGMTTMPYGELYGKKWQPVDNEADLVAFEALHPRTWIVYTTPTHMQAAFPDIWRRLHESYREVETFWGTLAGCEIVVAMRERAP